MSVRSCVRVSFLVWLAATSACTARPAPDTDEAPAATPAAGDRPRVAVATVVSQQLSRDLRLPGELSPYEDVRLHARAHGFVESITVDIGSRVRQGQVVATIVAPELMAQRSAAEAGVQRADAERLAAEAQLAAGQSTYTRLTEAAKTPGIVAAHEVELAGQAVEAGRALVEAARRTVSAAEQTVASLRAMESYLQVTSPFDGVVTERLVHPGSLVGPDTAPLVRIEQTRTLRLAVAIPEVDVGGITPDQAVGFTVPAYPGRSFEGRVARITNALDPGTRTMLVEADVDNRDRVLAPGMFAEVRWASARPEASLFVPAGAVVTTTERTFVIRVRDGRTEWVDVKRGASMNGLIEVFGDLAAGDRIAERGTDEIRADTAVETVES